MKFGIERTGNLKRASQGGGGYRIFGLKWVTTKVDFVTQKHLQIRGKSLVPTPQKQFHAAKLDFRPGRK